ncbi:MAG TPA: cell division protein FtsH, partial [Lachnospiraceae bacterium]|nr:cell division protein FtsH [Lachnospiraceae bacterium]
MKNKAFRGMGLYFVLLVIGVALYFVITNRNADIYTAYGNENLSDELKAGKIVEVDIVQNNEVPTGTVYVSYDDGSQVIFYTADVKETQEICNKKADKDVEIKLEDVKRPSLFQKLAPYIFAVILAMIVLMILMSQTAAASGGNSKLMNFGKSRAKKDVHTGITFNDVAGLMEEKEELTEIVDFLRDPAKFVKMGARIPKGILLVGSPGTGKTLLAKAVAGEADVPFFSISGSDFVEMFVGVGASRVRDLFEDAKRNAPCMVFIDEIDAVARRRGTGLGGGHDEREQTLNQLLVEMDGFGTNQGIIVLAATNRVDILDPAIMRPGRFDRKVMVARPDVKGREEILKVHVRNKHLAEDVDIHEVARTTVGFTGADLENLMNEAAIRATRQNRAFIVKEDIDKSFIKVGIGTEKKSRVIPEEEKKITAYHEAGHAILFHELSDVGPVHTISIIPTGPGAAGYTMPLPEHDNIHLTRKKMLQTIMVDFGGRIAEELIFDDITTGASQDIKEATKTARDMVIKYGFSEKVGPINYETNEDDEVFLGKDLGHARNFG